MEWFTLFNRHRFEDLGPRTHFNRSPLQIDQDRITFSRPFRRLQKKTQVHPLPSNAHIRNRLVHTLEVASVGRSLGYMVGKNIEAELKEADVSADDLGYLVQATCLAHDIGNPPFGHAGEEVISSWMASWLTRHKDLGLDSDLAYFDGNAQGFRILTRADGYRQRGGMKLTFATLAAFLKYPWAADDSRSGKSKNIGEKFGYFQTERAAFEAVHKACALEGRNPRHPAVWLMEAADDIVYTLADLEDAVELNIANYSNYSTLVSEIPESIHSLQYEETDPQRIAYLRAKAIGRLIDVCAATFMENAEHILNGDTEPKSSLIDLAKHVHPKEYAAFDRIRQFNRNYVYFHPRKIEFEIAAKHVIGEALETFIPACLLYSQRGENQLDLRSRQIISLMQDYKPHENFSMSENIRCAIDFVSGMTDDYASYLAARLRGLDPPR